MVGCIDKICSNNNADLCKFKETDNVGDVPRSGRPKVAIKKRGNVKLTVKEIPHTANRHIPQNADFSKWSNFEIT